MAVMALFFSCYVCGWGCPNYDHMHAGNAWMSEIHGIQILDGPLQCNGQVHCGHWRMSFVIMCGTYKFSCTHVYHKSTIGSYSDIICCFYTHMSIFVHEIYCLFVMRVYAQVSSRDDKATYLGVLCMVPEWFSMGTLQMVSYCLQ